MTGIPQRRGPNRQPFQDVEPPKPFLRTPIGMRVLFLGILLVVAGLMLFVQRRRHDRELAEAAAASRAAEQAANAPTRSPAEVLEERRHRLSTVFEGALNDTVNGDDFIETPGYGKLIEILAGSAPDDVAQRAKYLDYATALNEPDLVRGEYVRVQGLLGGLSAYKLEHPVHGITDVWRGTIARLDGPLDTVVIDLVGDPPALELRKSPVEAEGILYRTVKYESRTGDQREAPYVLARTLRVLPVEDVGSKNALAKLLVTVAGVGAIVVYLLVRYSARVRSSQRAPRPVGFKKMFEAGSGETRSKPSNHGPPGS